MVAMLAADHAAETSSSFVEGFEGKSAGLLCGPISLALALRMLDIHAEVFELAREMHFNENGTSLEELRVAAERHGVLAEGYHLGNTTDARQITKDTPAIVQLRGDHFAVLWADNEMNHWLAEFPHKPRIVASSELQALWNPVVLVIRRPNTNPPFALSEASSAFPDLTWKIVALFGVFLVLLLSTFVRRTHYGSRAR